MCKASWVVKFATNFSTWWLLTVIAGEEIEVVESFEYENADIMVLFSNLKDFLLTVEGSGEDMLVTLRSVNVPELNIGLPRPVYVNLGKPLVVEDYC